MLGTFRGRLILSVELGGLALIAGTSVLTRRIILRLKHGTWFIAGVRAGNYSV